MGFTSLVKDSLKDKISGHGFSEKRNSGHGFPNKIISGHVHICSHMTICIDWDDEEATRCLRFINS